MARDRRTREERRAGLRHHDPTPRCGHHNTRGARCIKDRGHGGMHRSKSGKYWY